jgi:SAM-dependent methyltransferase
MAGKFRQIQKFTELLTHLLAEAGLFTPSLVPGVPAVVSTKAGHSSLRVIDMGSGKGYLSFAVAGLLGDLAEVTGIEARPELVELCNRVARENDFSTLKFIAGEIGSFAIENPLDVLIALHACDTATDDALAKGIAAGAALLVVSPCCQKELRPQLTAPPVLADALRHGIFQERHAEFVTDALRAQLLEWAGYRTKVFEFVSTEHTARNLMIAAIKTRPAGDLAAAARLREFAAFYGIRTQRLATHLGVSLVP